MNFGYGYKARAEKVRFLLTLDKTRADKFREALSAFPPNINDAANGMIPGDELRITYDINIDYFGNVVGCLEALKTILSDPDVIICVGLDELTHGQCLIAAVIDRLREVQQIIEGRQHRGT